MAPPSKTVAFAPSLTLELPISEYRVNKSACRPPVVGGSNPLHDTASSRTTCAADSFCRKEIATGGAVGLRVVIRLALSNCQSCDCEVSRRSRRFIGPPVGSAIAGHNPVRQVVNRRIDTNAIGADDGKARE